MVICIDCGNTSIKIGVYNQKVLVSSYVIKTSRDKTCDEYVATIGELMPKDLEVEGAIISSVVPLLTPQLEKAVKKLFKVNPLILNKTLKTKIPLHIDNPNEFGSDMLAGAVAAKEKYGFPLVVADLGTATKLYVIDKNGAIIGCAISCGLAAEIRALSENASQLMEVPIEEPSKIIGKNTKDSIQSGIIFGQAFMVSEFARRMEAELGYKLERIVTGGYASIIKNQIVCFHYEESLTLDGLNTIYQMNKGGKENEK